MNFETERADFEAWWDGCKVVRTAEARHAAWQAWQARAQQQAASAAPAYVHPGERHPVQQVLAWAADYDKIGGHALIVSMLHSYAEILAQQQAASGVPDGWPTDAMIEAGRNAANSHGPLLGSGQSLWHVFRDMLAAATTPTVPNQQQAASVPDGWQLVPQEATDEMIEAAGLCEPTGSVRAAWRDMLAAARNPPLPRDRFAVANAEPRIGAGPPTVPADVMADAWQPIETAPKDGTTILVLCPDSTHRKIDAAHYHEDPWHMLKRPWCSSWCVDGLPVSGTPTRWMPLPPDHVECAAEKGTT